MKHFFLLSCYFWKIKDYFISRTEYTAAQKLSKKHKFSWVAENPQNICSNFSPWRLRWPRASLLLQLALQGWCCHLLLIPSNYITSCRIPCCPSNACPACNRQKAASMEIMVQLSFNLSWIEGSGKGGILRCAIICLCLLSCKLMLSKGPV